VPGHDEVLSTVKDFLYQKATTTSPMAETNAKTLVITQESGKATIINIFVFNGHVEQLFFKNPVPSLFLKIISHASGTSRLWTRRLSSHSNDSIKVLVEKISP